MFHKNEAGDFEVVSLNRFLQFGEQRFDAMGVQVIVDE